MCLENQSSSDSISNANVWTVRDGDDAGFGPALVRAGLGRSSIRLIIATRDLVITESAIRWLGLILRLSTVCGI